MIIRPLSFVFGAFTSLFLFYLCILNYEIAHRYVVASQSVLSNQCTPPSAGHINVTTSIGLDLDTNATSHLTEAETVPLESQISNATLCVSIPILSLFNKLGLLTLRTIPVRENPRCQPPRANRQTRHPHPDRRHWQHSSRLPPHRSRRVRFPQSST